MADALGMQRSLEASRDQSVARIDQEKQNRKREIMARVKEQITHVDTAYGEKISQLESSIAGIEGQIGSLESALSNIPANHPERPRLENQLKKYRQYKQNMLMQINALKARKRSQAQLIKFQGSQQLEMLEIKVSQQKSMLLRQFTERILSLKENQMRMSQMQQQRAGKSVGAKDARSEGGKQAG